VGTAENLGYVPSVFMERDNSVHEGGIGDGYHTQDELRAVIQRDIDIYDRSGQNWDHLQESRRMLQSMQNANIDVVDYLPEQLRGVPKELRTRAVDVMKIAYDIGDGTVDQAVIDRARRNYQGMIGSNRISRERGDQILRELQQISDFLGLR
jgi:hypothetical protein